MRDYGYHRPSDDEPWWAEVAERSGPRYQRAIALSRWRRELAAPPGLLPGPRTRERRRQCVEGWRHYLDTGQAPPEL